MLSEPPDLDLRILDLAGAALAKLDVSHLDDGERRRMRALRRPADRLRYAASHVLLRQMLTARTGIAPGELALGREPCPACGEPHGRPALRQRSDVHFSLATSGQLALVAVASLRVGVDLEALPSAETWRAASRLLDRDSQAQLRAAPPAERAATFTRLWTRKEAHLKACGTGVVHGLAREFPRDGGIVLRPVGVPRGYAAALALASGTD